MYTGSEHELAHHRSQGRSKNKASTSLYDSLMLIVACMVKEEVEKAMSFNNSLVLVVAAIVEGEAKIKHQRVVMTRWCWLWLPWSRENRKKKKHQQVVMTRWCLHGRGRSNQQVFTTCWCWFWPAWSREGGGRG